jgi:hypothetical protein
MASRPNSYSGKDSVTVLFAESGGSSSCEGEEGEQAEMLGSCWLKTDSAWHIYDCFSLRSQFPLRLHSMC